MTALVRELVPGHLEDHGCHLFPLDVDSFKLFLPAEVLALYFDSVVFRGDCVKLERSILLNCGLSSDHIWELRQPGLGHVDLQANAV